MTGSGFASLPLFLVQLTAGGWGLFEVVRLIREWRRTGLRGDVASTLVVLLGIVVAVWLDGLLARAHLLDLPVTADVHLWIGLAGLWMGLGLRGWAHAALGDLYTTTVLIQRGKRLVSTGPYAQLRHPSYAGLCLALLGLAVAGGSGASILTTVALLSLVFTYRIPVEERALRAAYGADYDRYAAKTKRIVPGLY